MRGGSAAAGTSVKARDILLGFDGRLPRKTFLVWGVPAFIAGLLVYVGLAGLLARSMEGARSEGTASLLVLALGFFPFAPLLAKRLHDLDVSGWWLALLATPEFLNSASLALGWSGTRSSPTAIGTYLDYLSLVGGAGLALLAVWPGTRGANRFGADPRETA
jgi:uncharacterized membrane protein YhaH (DUF805 family)